jgi:ribosome biogenesis SPOUT family RNA methylase Rps3
MLGWKQKSSIDSAEGAAQAVREGYKLVGMRFNDTEEVGYQVAKALIEVTGQ